MKRLGVFLLPLDGMLVHRRSLTRNLLGFLNDLPGTYLCTWVEKGTVRVKCLAQEHNTVCPARARIQTARSGDERANYDATATRIMFLSKTFNFSRCIMMDPILVGVEILLIA